LIKNSNWSSFPPRLFNQPIFYPILNQEYAEQIAREWNTRESGSGFVTKFEVEKKYIDKYKTHNVGGHNDIELWIPSEDLEEFNSHIIGKIEVLKEFYRDKAENEK
jgi:hypothetical protein